MKKVILLISSIIVLVLSFTNCWYLDHLLGHLWILGIIPSIMIYIIYFVIVGILIKHIKEKVNKINIATAIILVITAGLVVFFPFREAKVRLELNLYEKDRLEVIQMVKESILVPDEYGNVVIPEKYKMLTTDGEREIHVYQNDSEGQVISFWVLRGVQSGSIELMYSTGGEELIRANETGHPIISIEKLKDNWYYVVTDY